MPEENGLSDEERSELALFEKCGGKVFYYDEYLDSFKPSCFCGRWTDAYEIAEKYGEKIASVADKKVDLKFLSDENEYAISVIDFAEDEREISHLEIKLHAAVKGENCLFMSGEKVEYLPIDRGENVTVTIPKLKNGGILFIEKR